MKRSRRDWLEFIGIVVFSFVLIFIGLSLVSRAEAEPFPEYLKDNSQAFECHTVSDTGPVDKWIINWRMATEWFPNAKEPYIIFQGRRTTVLPTPPEYVCVLWSPPKTEREK